MNYVSVQIAFTVIIICVIAIIIKFAIEVRDFVFASLMTLAFSAVVFIVWAMP